MRGIVLEHVATEHDHLRPLGGDAQCRAQRRVRRLGCRSRHADGPGARQTKLKRAVVRCVTGEQIGESSEGQPAGRGETRVLAARESLVRNSSAPRTRRRFGGCPLRTRPGFSWAGREVTVMTQWYRQAEPHRCRKLRRHQRSAAASCRNRQGTSGPSQYAYPQRRALPGRSGSSALVDGKLLVRGQRELKALQVAR